MEIKETNQEVEKKFKKIGIRYINMVAVGNSISSGYSRLHTIRPSLDYNETIKENIEGLETYHFARAQDNCDAHIYKWLQNNYRLSDIYQMNRRDYALMPLAIDKSKRVIGMTPENNPTQVYLCGAPRFDIPLEQFINTKLRSLAKRNPAVTYIKPLKRHLIQKVIMENLA